MKLRNTVILLFCMLAAVQLKAQTSEDAYTLQECLEYAYVNSINTKNAMLDQEIAQADVKVAKADGLPQANVRIAYDNNYAIQRVFIPDFISPSVYQVLKTEGLLADDKEVPNPGVFPAAFGTTHSGNAGLTVTQMIFDGSFFVGLEGARVFAELKTKDYELTKINVAEAVTKAYYLVLVNKERAEFSRDDVERLDTLLYETRAMYESGFAEKIDVDRISVQYNNAKVQLNRVERSLELGYQLLKFQMGMPINTPITLADKIEDVDPNPTIAGLDNFEYTDRTEFAQIQTNVRLTELQKKLYQVDRLPKLNASLSAGYNAGTNRFSDLTKFDDNWFQYGVVGVSLSFPIFDGFRRTNQIQKNELQIQQLNNQTENLRNNIDLEIAEARFNLQNSMEALEVQKENRILARDVYDVAKIKYQEGIGSNLEVVDAETALKEAETNFYSALYDALIAKVELDKALGILVE
jgi:outer membrane protein